MFQYGVGTATPKLLWLARTEERLASLPGEPAAWTLAQDGLRHAEKALRQAPDSRRALMIYWRAKHRVGVLSENTSQQQEVLAELHAGWASEKQRGLWAHDFLELLFESWSHDRQREDLRAQALEVLTEVTRRAQWQGDVHVERWRKEFSALRVERHGVLDK